MGAGKKRHHEDTKGTKRPAFGILRVLCGFVVQGRRGRGGARKRLMLFSRRHVVAAFLVALCCLALPHWAVAQGEMDQAALAKARELMALYEQQDAMGDFLDRSASNITKVLEQQNPGKTDEIGELIAAKFLPMARGRLPEFYESIAAIYAQHFTAAELQDLIDFFGTTTGQKFAKQWWTMTAETYVLGVRWTSKVTHEVLDDLTPELQKHGLKILQN